MTNITHSEMVARLMKPKADLQFGDIIAYLTRPMIANTVYYFEA